MKILKSDEPYIPKHKWKQVCLAVTIITIVMYVIAMICSLSGNSYFILNYQNTHLDNIEAWFREHNAYSVIATIFLTLEFYIILTFILHKRANLLYPLIFYIGIIIPICFVDFPDVYYSVYPFFFYITVPMFEELIKAIKVTKDYKLMMKNYGKCLLRLIFSIVTTLGFQAMILVIKAGYFDGKNHIMNLSAHFIYAIEYDIALVVTLYTVSLFINREKGDNNSWTTYHSLGGSSQISTKQSQKSNTKNLTKTQKNKIFFIYFKMYFIQIGTFILVMVLPFLLGKVFEFLLMYLVFCTIRYILGFKYSLHFKKEVLCITAGITVFGILSLVVPFFYVVIILAVFLGATLAVLLHLSYKYKAFYMFNKIARPDRFAELYVLMDGNLSRHHVSVICYHCGIPKEDIGLMCDFAEGNKKSYLAKKYNYSEKTIERKINELIDVINRHY